MASPQGVELMVPFLISLKRRIDFYEQIAEVFSTQRSDLTVLESEALRN